MLPGRGLGAQNLRLASKFGSEETEKDLFFDENAGGKSHQEPE
jgi:hypothetical protein